LDRKCKKNTKYKKSKITRKKRLVSWRPLWY